MHRLMEPAESFSTMRITTGEQVYGAKCARLLELRSLSEFHNTIPPVFPISGQLGKRFLLHNPSAHALSVEARADGFAHWLGATEPDFIEDVRQQCGSPPWIVRSSGPEDSPDLLESGIFTSIVCEDDTHLARVLSEVIFSGFRSHTSAYLHRTGRRPEAIPVFIQPVITSGESIEAIENELPAISLPLLGKLENILLELHRIAWPCTLICEWVLEGKEAVSATTVTTPHEQALSGDGWFGFGRASAQTNLGEVQNSRAVWLPGVNRPLLSGGKMRAVSQGTWRLLQVRPTTRWTSRPMVCRLAPEEQSRLLNRGFSAVASGEILVPVPSLPLGKFLVSESISWAWHMYGSMPDGVRKEIKAVFVATGSSAEHAGIMFRQQEIMVARLDAESIPAGAVTVVADCSTGICYFSSDSALQLQLRTEQVPADQIPADASLYLEPADARTLAPDEALTLILSLVRSLPVDPERVLADHPGLPEIFRAVAHCEFLSAQQRIRVLHQSLVGAPGSRIKEPSLDAVLPSWLGLNAISGPGLTRSFCEHAAQAIANDHPARSYLLSRWQSRGLLPARRPLSAEVLEVLIEHPTLAQIAAQGELETLLDSLVSESQETQLCVVRLLVRFHDALTALGLYTAEEGSRLWEQLLQLLRVSESAVRIQPLISTPEITAPHLVWWLQKATDDPDGTALGMSAYKHARHLLRGLASGATSYATEAVRALVDLRQAFLDLGAPAELNLFPVAIDAFDIGGKRLLNSMSLESDSVAWQDYIALLSGWIEFLRQIGGPQAALGVFESWLREQRQSPSSNDFTLQNEHWTTWVQKAEREGHVELPNVHQLQNILHQMSLGLVPEPQPASLPLRVQHLVRHANTFRKRRNRLLRLESGKFEIERSMGIHKASLVFTPRGVTTEFYDPPSATAEDLARINVFQGLLVRFNDWWPEQTFAFRKEHLAGSFGLSIWTTPRCDSADLFESNRFAYEVLVTMFDMAYDLSGVETSLGDLRGRFSATAWGRFFTGLVGYRSDLDDSAQHVALRSYPLGHFLLTMVLNPDLEDWLLSWLDADFTSLYTEIKNRALRFGSSKDSAEWIPFKKRLELLSLLCAVNYPEQAWNALAKEPVFDWGFDALGRSLLRRRSMVKNICGVAGRLDAEHLGEFDLFLVRHAPDIFISSENALHVANRISSSPAAHARASAILVHRFATRIPREALRILLNSMMLVPFGADPAIEDLLRAEAPQKSRYNILYPLTVRPIDLSEIIR